MDSAIIVAIITALTSILVAILGILANRHKKEENQTKSEDRHNNLITHSDLVPIFTPGQSHITSTMVSNTLSVDFSNNQAWSGIAFVFTPKLDVRKLTHLDISGSATPQCTFQIEYKAHLGGELKIVASSSFQSFPATHLVSTLSIPLRYDGALDEIAIMFYNRGETSHITMESMRLA